MKNVYDILRENELVYILPESCCKREYPHSVLASLVVVAYLYYPECLEFYFGYLDHIPSEIDVYIISSNPLTEEKIRNYAWGKDHVHYIRKNNRGRDVSALLVTAGNILLQYEYICFVHDKKPNFDYLSEDIKLWNRNLWDNSLKSEQYILNVLGTFVEHDDIGLLVPPKPIGEYMPDWYTDAWHGNFDNVQQLCKEFGLQCDLDFQRPVITLGTVFWARTKIFQKLLSKRWKYEDFSDEPMPIDGTKSHALERVLAYAAQDARFNTGVVMCESYARTLYIKVQNMMELTYRHLQENFYIGQMDQLANYKRQREQASQAFAGNRPVYLYGAGQYGRRFLNMLHMWGYSPRGFLVSDGHRKEDAIGGYMVWELGELRETDAVIAITANYDKHHEMMDNLKKYNFHDYFVAC